MRLYAAFAQALPPTASDRLRLTQLPGISVEDIAAVAPKAKDMSDVLHSLEEKDDPRSKDVKKTLEKWGRVQIVEAAFKGESSASNYCWFDDSPSVLVIGERIVTPSSIIYLLVKLRISPPGASSENKELSVEDTKTRVQKDEEIDEKFLTSRLDAEELPTAQLNGVAHAPFWPGVSSLSCPYQSVAYSA